VVDFSFSLSPGGQLTSSEVANAVLSPDAVAEPYILGESNYYCDHVQPSLLNNTAREVTKALLAWTRKVRETDLEDAVDIATEMIETTLKMTETVRPPSEIGGSIDIRIITDGLQPIKRR
jgi:hypothetical protein